jgi:hypothetical protein
MTSSATEPPACESLDGPHAGPARLYPCGWQCDVHTPNARAGRPEPPPGPGWPIHRDPPDPTDELEPAA